MQSIQEREIRMEDQEKVARDINRFADFASFLNKQLGRKFFADNPGWIVDVAGGDGDPAIGLLCGLRDYGFKGGYFSFDIMNKPISDPIYIVSKIEFAPDWQKRIDQLMLLGNKAIRREYGDRWDARITNVWQAVEQEVGTAALLIARHLDVQGNEDNFQQIITNMLSYALLTNIPIWLTTSNFDSQDKLYDMISKGMRQFGYVVETKQQDFIYPMLDIKYIGNNRYWQLRTYWTRSMSRLLPYTINAQRFMRGEFGGKRLDLLSILIGVD
jgi:hypothetical protein